VTTPLDRAGANSPRFSPARPANVEQFATIPELHSVYFEYDKARIRPEAASILERNVEWLKANAFQEVVIAAYADERGTAQYNFGLAERRARALR
jgi:peptidoglycan-associated lipoprotein